MKKIIHGLLGAALLTSSAFGAVSNKTFMAARGTLSDNVVMGMTAAACGKKSGFGADINVAGFFRQSHNSTDLAKYFGEGLTDAARDGQIEAGQNIGGGVHDLYKGATGTLTLNPRRTEFGGHIQWNQCLGKVLKGLSFSVNVPVVRVETEMRTTSTNAALLAHIQGGAAGVTGPVTDALAYQKHSATKRHETGVANVDVAVNYEFAREADYSVGGSIALEIPTGNKPAAVWAFEPLYGSKHFALGAGLNADFNLWKSEGGNSRFDFCAGVNYKYGFKAKEVRTFGVYDNVAAAEINRAHYLAMANDATESSKPAANRITLETDVTPQSSIDAVTGFKYKTGQFCVNVAYNLNWNQEEKVAAPAYTADAYGLVSGDIDGTDHLVLDTALAAATATTGHRISTTACTTPSKVTHKVGGGIDYSLCTKTPIRFGVFGEGEWNANNDSINSWAVGGKVGFCF